MSACIKNKIVRDIFCMGVVAPYQPPICANRTTSRLQRDAQQHARSVKETLEAEYGDRMAAALEQSEEAAALSSTAQKKAARLGEEQQINRLVRPLCFSRGFQRWRRDNKSSRFTAILLRKEKKPGGAFGRSSWLKENEAGEI